MNVDVNCSRSNAIVDLASCKVKKELKNYPAKMVISSRTGQGNQVVLVTFSMLVCFYLLKLNENEKFDIYLFFGMIKRKNMPYTLPAYILFV